MSKTAIALSLLITLCLCACAGSNEMNGNILERSSIPADTKTVSEDDRNLEKTIDCTMSALKNLDMEKFNTNTNNRQLMVNSWGGENIEYTLFGELCDGKQSGSELSLQLDKEIVKNLSWETLDIEQYGDSAKIKLAITNLDMDGIFQKIQTDSEMIKEISKIPTENTKTSKINIKAKKQDDTWVLLIDLDFVNAISANLWVIDTNSVFHETHGYGDSRSITDSKDSLSSFFANLAVSEAGEKQFTIEGVRAAAKEQKITIVSAADSSVLAEITDIQNIVEFLNQEQLFDWYIIDELPKDASHLLTIIRYAPQRKTINPQLEEQSRDLLYQSGQKFYIEDKTNYTYTESADYKLPCYYEIPNDVGEYLKVFL